MGAAARIFSLFVIAFAAIACSSAGKWGGAAVSPAVDGNWRPDVPAMLAEPAIKAELERGDAAAREKFLRYLRTVRLDIRGSRIRGGTRRNPSPWFRFRVIRSGRDYLVIRYQVKKEFAPATVRLDLIGVNRLRFKEVENKDAPPLSFKR